MKQTTIDEPQLNFYVKTLKKNALDMKNILSQNTDIKPELKYLDEITIIAKCVIKL